MYLWSQRSPSNLGAMGFRPNQAVQRAVYASRRTMAGMADDLNVAVDPTMLIAGAGVLAVALLLLTGKKAAGAVRGYRRKRMRGKRRKLQRQLLALGGD
jgi:hypothetical protein